MVLAFLGFIALVVIGGARLGFRFARENKRIDALLAEHRQSWAIADAADMATDGDEKEVTL